VSEDEKLEYSHKIDGAEFVRRLRDNVNRGDCPTTFFLGAGCSVSSGILASQGLVRDDWLPRLRKIRGGPPGQSVDE